MKEEYKQIGLEEYIDNFKNDSVAARSLSITPQRLYFIRLKHEEYFVKVYKDKKVLCKIVTESEVEENEKSSITRLRD